MAIYRYETHLHTAPVSRCARSSVRETIEFYKGHGYAGIFITNHFLDGNINIDRSLPYEERVEFFFSDYEEGVAIGRELDFPVFCGVELSYGGTDFLVYGLDKAWFLAHPEIEAMKKKEELQLLLAAGALVIQAHPFREAGYIDHIRLYPREVEGVEVYNACRTELENHMAGIYAENYGLLPFAGTDCHNVSSRRAFGGMEADTPLENEADFVRRVRAGEMRPFRYELPEETN